MKVENIKLKVENLIMAVMLLFSLPAFAFEDVVISNNSKLTDIRIENHDIIDVCPLITIMNDKNTLIVHPLKTGATRFSAIKDNKEKVMFSVKVEPEKTTVDEVKGFDILAVDFPPNIYEYELDLPPEGN